MSDLVARSQDWVGVIDGGPGDDMLRGTQARDRLDGGSGSDVLYGLGGNDQLWGDGGPGQGDPDNDHDVIFAGQGNDDALGGQGGNDLYAWSYDPDSAARLGFDNGQSVQISSSTQTSVTLTAARPIRRDQLRLWDDLFLTLTVGSDEPVLVRVPTTTVTSVDELATAVQAAMAAYGVTVGNNGGHLTLTAEASSLTIERATFGVFVDEAGMLHSYSGDLDGDGNLDARSRHQARLEAGRHRSEPDARRRADHGRPV